MMKADQGGDEDAAERERDLKSSFHRNQRNRFFFN